MSCGKDNNGTSNEDLVEDELYFPPIISSEWEMQSIDDLNWNTSNLDNLYDFLQESDTGVFLVLKDRKIVIGKYWGNTFLNTDQFDKTSSWYWASAGKTFTSFLVGIAEQEGLLTIKPQYIWERIGQIFA